MTELIGGPLDGVVRDMEAKPYIIWESRQTCHDPRHEEFRLHRYEADGSYVGPSTWKSRSELHPSKR